MFSRVITALTGSGLNREAVSVPRPSEALRDACAPLLERIENELPEEMTLTERAEEPDRFLALQKERRAELECLLFTELGRRQTACAAELIDLVLREPHWGASPVLFEDPFFPEIDLQAAETGVLLAWFVRRHGTRLTEADPRLSACILNEVRNRLLKPVSSHEDYPFLSGSAPYSLLILSDLLIVCLLLEVNPSARLPHIKCLSHAVDHLLTPGLLPARSYPERVADACAVADAVRIIKRMTKGETDLSSEIPPAFMQDDIFIPYGGGSSFFDPFSDSLESEVSGLDLFRFGYFCRDRAIACVGASLHKLREKPCASVTGRVLSEEYLRAAMDETQAPPKLKHASSRELLLSRVGGMACALTPGSGRGDAGGIYLTDGASPVLTGNIALSLPLIAGIGQQSIPPEEIPTEKSFLKERDTMTADLTNAWPAACGLNACQRTLMVMRSDDTVRLVDAFEFTKAPEDITFRFPCAEKPVPAADGMRIGNILLSSDGSCESTVAEEDGCFLLSLKYTSVPSRFICGFTFEKV